MTPASPSASSLSRPRGTEENRHAPVVVIGGDDAFALPLAVTMSSVLGVLPDGATLYVLDRGISSPNADRLRALAARRGPGVRVRWIAPETSRVDHLPLRGHLGAATYLRLLLPYVLPDTLTRVLYLDADAVVQHALSALWDVDLEGHAVAACPDSTIPFVKDGIASHQQQGLLPNAPYFNAGVLLIDLARWRAEATSEHVVDNIASHRREYRYPDQDGLNAVLAGDWKALPISWNVQVGSGALRRRPTPAGEAAIVHFTSDAKPWSGKWKLKNKAGLLGDYRRVFFSELRRSGWLTEGAYVRFRMRLAVEDARAVAGNSLPSRAYRKAIRLARARASSTPRAPSQVHHD